MTGSDDVYNLRRFVEVQESIIEDVKQELRTGRKRTHWMWYIFPQIEGLGNSRKSQRYGISSREEAKAYLEHPILGPRLRKCTEIVNNIEGRSSNEIFGTPDDLKFRSSMTLFDTVADDPEPFRTALRLYYDGELDQKTLDLLDA